MLGSCGARWVTLKLSDTYWCILRRSDSARVMLGCIVGRNGKECPRGAQMHPTASRNPCTVPKGNPGHSSDMR
eukprot:7931122-Pyramimonas_sp.AAC.1